MGTIPKNHRNIFRAGQTQIDVARYVYDALGRRIEARMYSNGGFLDRKRYWYNDQWQILDMEYADTSYSFDLNYVWGNYIDECLLFIYNADLAPERYYYLHDHLYSPAAVVDAGGTVGERYEYDAYGTVHNMDAAFAVQPGSYYLALFGLTGREVDMLDYDSQTGGYRLQHMHYRHRDYSPAIGRFVQHDPLGMSVNL